MNIQDARDLSLQIRRLEEQIAVLQRLAERIIPPDMRKQALADQASHEKQECIVYDVERILGVLDSPEGYGVRVGYLRIPMSSEEQIAYFASRENVLEGIVAKSADNIQLIASQLASLGETQRYVAHSMDVIAKAQNITIEPLRAFDPLAMGEITATAADSPIMPNVTPATILFTHRLVCFELPPRLIGRFRDEPVYIQKAAAAPGAPTFSPPPPAEVRGLVDALCKHWRDRYITLTNDDKKAHAIAEFFHRLMFVHPFIDGMVAWRAVC